MKLGKYDIPEMRLYPDLVEATKTIYEKFKSEEATDLLTVAQLLGHKSDKSGAFFRKMSSMRAYGLIEKRGVKVTDIGKSLTYGATEEERNKALKEAVLNIPLWKEFHRRYGANLPKADFWADLTKITALEAPDAKKVEEIVRKAYLDDFQYVKEEKEPEKGGKDMEGQGKFDTLGAKSKGTPIEEQADIVKGLIKQGAYDIAKEFIDFLKTKKEETPEEEG